MRTTTTEEPIEKPRHQKIVLKLPARWIGTVIFTTLMVARVVAYRGQGCFPIRSQGSIPCHHDRLDFAHGPQLLRQYSVMDIPSRYHRRRMWLVLSIGGFQGASTGPATYSTGLGGLRIPSRRRKRRRRQVDRGIDSLLNVMRLGCKNVGKPQILRFCVAWVSHGPCLKSLPAIIYANLS